MDDKFDSQAVARKHGVSAQLAESVNATCEALQMVFNASDLDANDLFYMAVAAAVRMGLQSGAPANELRDSFFRALDSFTDLAAKETA